MVAVAARPMIEGRDTYSLADEQALTLIGYVAFLDPPKESTAPALKALAAHGVAVKVLTGDNELVTAKICREVGLEQQGLLMGNDIERMSDAELAVAVETTNVFAKLTPSHKERIVRLLKGNGHVVGFMGDGINDAPALRTADIGISVDSAVDIAKEAADIILLEKSLMVLEEGVLEGRRTFANMLKYIKMTASSNFGNVFSVLVASAFIPFLPMLPMHLLVQNLLYDISQIAIPFDNVDEEMLKATTTLAAGGCRAFHAVFRADQLDLRHHHVCLDVVRVRRQYPGPSNPVPVRLVRGRAADPDADRAHDPHAENPVPAKPRSDAADGDDWNHHGRRHLPADGTAGALLQIAGAAVAVLRVPAGDSAGVHGPDAGGERVLYPPVWLAVMLPNEEQYGVLRDLQVTGRWARFLGKVLQKARRVFRSLAPSRI